MNGFTADISRQRVLTGRITANAGSGSAANYNDLSGKPRINGVVLQGDMSFGDIAPSYLSLSDTPSALPADGGNADTVSGHRVLKDVPADAVFTDTLYDDSVIAGRVSALETLVGSANSLLENALEGGGGV